MGTGQRLERRVGRDRGERPAVGRRPEEREARHAPAMAVREPQHPGAGVARGQDGDGLGPQEGRQPLDQRQLAGGRQVHPGAVGQAEPGTMQEETFSITHDVPPQIDREYDKLYEFVGIKPIKFTLDDKEISAGKYALFFRGRYMDIQDDKSIIEPASDCVSIRYDGILDVNRVLARNILGTVNADGQKESESEPAPEPESEEKSPE